MRWICLLGFAGLSTVAQADPERDLIAANAKLAQLNGFHVRVLEQSDKGRVFSEVWLQDPTRYRIQANPLHVIAVPGKTCVNQNGKWSAVEMDTLSLVKQFIDPVPLREIRAQSQQFGDAVMTPVKDIGLQPFGRDNVRGLQFELTRRDGAVRESVRTTMLVGKLGVPVRVSVERVSGKQQSTQIKDYSYDPTLRISVPAACASL